MTIAKLGDPQTMAGRERDSRENEPLDAEAAPATQTIIDPEAQVGARPERAAAQLCQLKLKYEYAPQSPTKRRSDASEAPCSPSVETLLTATVRRVELEMANEFAPEPKRSREDRASSADGRPERRSELDLAGGDAADAASRTQDKDTPVSVRRTTNGERRSSESSSSSSSAVVVLKRKDFDSPISSPVTRSQTVDEDVGTRDRPKLDSVMKCNGAVTPKSSQKQSAVVIPKVVVTKVVTGNDASSANSQPVSSVAAAIAVKVAGNSSKRETNSSRGTNDDDSRSRSPDKLSARTASKAKVSEASGSAVAILSASNGVSQKSTKAVIRRETTASPPSESAVDAKSNQKSAEKLVPVKTLKTRHSDSVPVADTPCTSNGCGESSGSAIDCDTEPCTPKSCRTSIVQLAKPDVRELEFELAGTDLISTKSDDAGYPVSTTERLSGAPVSSSKRAREASADDGVESVPKKIATASTGRSSPSPVNRRKDTDTPVASPVMKDTLDSPSSPMTRSMSRRLEETAPCDSGVARLVQSNPPTNSNGSEIQPMSAPTGDASSAIVATAPSIALVEPPMRRQVRFDRVTVYLFERTQGFTSVPTQGGSTLGMGSTHQDLEEYSIEEFAERKRLQSRPTGSPTATLVLPIPTKQRRELLRRSGVRDIDALEKDECESIRASRERCGCVCQGRCEPVMCLCIMAGISCQVEVFSQMDRSSFPCGCTREGCDNPNGRTEFDPVKVKEHVHQTRLRANRELGLPEEQIQAIQDRMDAVTCEYSSEGSDNSSVCSENSDYASSDEALAPMQLPVPSLSVVTVDPAMAGTAEPATPGQVDPAKEDPSEDSGTGGTSVDSVPA